VRVIVLGAGAIGGTIGARLAEAGHDVTLVARGAHAAAMRERGLRVVSPDGEQTVHLPVVEHPRELALAGDELVILTTKSQDTPAALDALRTVAPGATIACAQNGVANEREAARRAFAHVVAIHVWMAAQHLEPGVVEVGSAPCSGILELGSYPSGSDDRVAALAAALTAATFDTAIRTDVMRWKYRKLITNLGNAVDALCVRDDAARELARRARDEGRAVLQAARIDTVPENEARPRLHLDERPIAGRPRTGGSSWQSLARRTGTIEADQLNGEIVLLGQQHHIPTPINARLQQLASAHAGARRPPRSLDARELL